MALEVDFSVAEIEKGTDFGGDQTGGQKLVRLLAQVGFGEVHIPYFLPNMEPKIYEARYAGILMLRGSERLYQIRREDLVEICHTIFFDHYLAWYQDFFTDQQLASYRKHLDSLLRDLRESLSKMPIVKVNGADPGGLIEWHENENVRSPEFKITWYAGILVGTGDNFGGRIKITEYTLVCSSARHRCDADRFSARCRRGKWKGDQRF